jgi:D-glycero-beta-D-manno-heptose 1-phosphate adenylyltransferase
MAGDELQQWLALWRFKSKTIVFTNGCFDVLHRGHIEYLASAASEGDILVIGLNSDASVTRLKGPGRPVHDQYSRALALASLRFVEAVVIFDEDTPLQLIQEVRPDVLAKGADYEIADIVGAADVMSWGGRVVQVDLVEGYSSSRAIRLIEGEDEHNGEK